MLGCGPHAVCLSSHPGRVHRAFAAAQTRGRAGATLAGMNKPPNRTTPAPPAPAAAPAAPVLADQKAEFTAEGAPPPGHVGPAAPEHEPARGKGRRRRGG